MPDNVTLRLAQRSDISALAHISNAANAKSAIHRRMAPWQDQYPSSHYHWRLNQKLAHPDYLCVHLIAIAPSAQGRGVGRKLIDWGKDLATREKLPLFLESNLEATGFYEKAGFSRMSQDFIISPGSQEPLRIPIYVWEGKQNEGIWLERDVDFDGAGERCRWRNEVLPKRGGKD